MKNISILNILETYMNDSCLEVVKKLVNQFDNVKFDP